MCDNTYTELNKTQFFPACCKSGTMTLGPETRDVPQNLKVGPGTPESWKVGPHEPLQNFKVGPQDPFQSLIVGPS